MALAKIQLLDFFSKYKSGMGLRSKKTGNLLLYLTLILLAIPFIQMSVGAYHTFLLLGRPELAVTFMYITTVLFMSFTAIPFLFSLFFYAGDIKFLVTLPIPEEFIVFAKLSTVYLYLLVINSLVLAPTMVLGGINFGLTVGSIILVFIAWLLAPLPPLLFSAVVALGLTRLAAKSSKKNILSLFFGFALLFLLLGIQLFITGESGSQVEYWTITLGRFFPPAQWLARMVTGSVKDFLYFILLNFIMVTGLRVLAAKLYRSAVLAFNEKEVIRKGGVYYRQRSKTLQLLRRNLLIILKQPVFLMNTLLSLAVPCLLLLISIITGDLSLDTLVLPENKGRAVLLFVGVLSAPALLANLSATAITREGSAFWETKVLPVEPWDNIRSRMMTTVSINLLASLLIGSFTFRLLRIEAAFLLAGLFFVIMLTLFLATIDLLINLYRPYLKWTNPAAAIKNNLNVLFSLALRPLLAIIPSFLFISWPTLGYRNILYLTGLIFFVLYLLTRKYLKNLMIRKFDQIIV
jgi:ABC-2 type transport system permease protein